MSAQRGTGISIVSRLAGAADGEPLALRGDQVLDFAFLRARAGAWHQVLHDAGPRVAVYTADAVECLAILLALWTSGRSALLPTDTAPATCARLRAHCAAFAGEFPATCAPLLLADPVPPDRGPEHLRSAGRGWLAPADVAFEVFTSGSSGAPSLVAKTLGQLDAEVGAIDRRWGALLDGALVTGSVPHQHMYGVIFRLLWPLAAGRPFVAGQAVYPEWLCRWSAGQEVVLISSPAFLSRVPAFRGWRQAGLRVRRMFSAGGALTAAAASQASETLDAPLQEIYGSSETGALATRDTTASNGPWHPLPGVELRAGPAPELLEVRSAQLPEAQTWYPLPDRAELNAGGGFRLLGRADRIVKIEDRRVSVAQVEDAIRTHEQAADCRVVVLQGHRTVLGAVVVMSAPLHLGGQGRRAAVRALRKHVAAQLDPVAVPRRWRLVAALPQNQMGKTTQAALAALFDAAPA